MLIPLLRPPGGLLSTGLSFAHSVGSCDGGVGWFVEGMVPKAARTGDEMPCGGAEGGIVEACN